MNLILYRCADLLLLFIDIGTKTSALRFLLDNVEIPKPYVGFNLVTAKQILIVASLQVKKHKRRDIITVEFDTSQVFSTSLENIPVFSVRHLQQLPHSDRQRCYKALFLQPPKLFKDFGKAQFCDVARQLAKPSSHAVHFANNLLYVRVKLPNDWTFTLGRFKATVTCVSSIDKKVDAWMFSERGLLNVILPYENIAIKEDFLLIESEFHEIEILHLPIPVLQNVSPEACLSNYSGNNAKLFAFIVQAHQAYHESLASEQSLNLVTVDFVSLCKVRVNLNDRYPFEQVFKVYFDAIIIFESNEIRCFDVQLPDDSLEGGRHSLCIWTSQDEKNWNLVLLKEIHANYRYCFEVVNTSKCSGWVFNQNNPEFSVSLDLRVNHKKVGFCKANISRDEVRQAFGLKNALVGFEFYLPEVWRFHESELLVECYIANTQHKLATTYVVNDYSCMIGDLIKVNQWLAGFADERISLRQQRVSSMWWLRSQVIMPLIRQLREQKHLPVSVSLPLTSQGVEYKTPKVYDDVIDVIIPVYKSYDETLACINSVLSAPVTRKFELIVINDKSPDSELTTKLRELSHQARIILYENDKNLGFVKTANRGMLLHPARDVLLLNSDTVVVNDWLDRIYAAAYQQANIGTVTPFSNNATICSFPILAEENVLPTDTELTDLDRLFSEQNHGCIIDIPTAVGFCMYIKRIVIEQIGVLDESKWAEGYGEENDFCLTASEYGWRHVLATDVFVQHHGSLSFGTTKKNDLIQRNLALLNQLYPDYDAQIQQFIVQDSPAFARNNVLKQLLKKRGGRHMLHVLHGLGGGAQKNAEELMGLLFSQREQSLSLRSKRANYWQLIDTATGYILIYQGYQAWEALLNDLSDLNIWHIHYHQIIGYPSQIWQLPVSLGVSYDITLHDYLYLCPLITMQDETGYYCDQSQFSVSVCTNCVKQNNPHELVLDLFEEHNRNVKSWRDFYNRILNGARRVFAPSLDTKERYQAHFPSINYSVFYHPEPPASILFKPSLPTKKLSIAVLGAIGTHKGYDLLLACVKSALKENLPLEFVIIGYTCNDKALEEYDNVVVTSQYQPEKLPMLINQYECKLAVFFNIWPETYSFTLSEAIYNGLYPVVFDLGAPAERLRALKFGRIISFTREEKKINQLFLKIGHEINQLPERVIELGCTVGNFLENYYGLRDD